MVGWTRRNRESMVRRNAWWNSLTPEQRRAARKREEAEDRVLMICFVVMLGLVGFSVLCVWVFHAWLPR